MNSAGKFTSDFPWTSRPWNFRLHERTSVVRLLRVMVIANWLPGWLGILLEHLSYYHNYHTSPTKETKLTQGATPLGVLPFLLLQLHDTLIMPKSQESTQAFEASHVGSVLSFAMCMCAYHKFVGYYAVVCSGHINCSLITYHGHQSIYFRLCIIVIALQRLCMLFSLRKAVVQYGPAEGEKRRAGSHSRSRGSGRSTSIAGHKLTTS